jgi:hypothetical protein
VLGVHRHGRTLLVPLSVARSLFPASLVLSSFFCQLVGAGCCLVCPAGAVCVVCSPAPC